MKFCGEPETGRQMNTVCFAGLFAFYGRTERGVYARLRRFSVEKSSAVWK
jgi:hypothetical protein